MPICSGRMVFSRQSLTKTWPSLSLRRALRKAYHAEVHFVASSMLARLLCKRNKSVRLLWKSNYANVWRLNFDMGFMRLGKFTYHLFFSICILVSLIAELFRPFLQTALKHTGTLKRNVSRYLCFEVAIRAMRICVSEHSPEHLCRDTDA